MNKIIIILVIILVSVSVWFAIDHNSLSKKLSAETDTFTNMQEQGFKQAQDIIILQSCASIADGIHADTGKYYSVVDCTNKQSSN